MSAGVGFETAKLALDLFSAVATAPKKKYTFLVVAALKEELAPFIKLVNATELTRKSGIMTFSMQNSKAKEYNMLAYSADRMGMPFNAVVITRLIERYKPKYVIFIGTCAGLNSKDNKKGDVLIPEYIYAYDAGKLNDNGKFSVEYRQFETSEYLQQVTDEMLASSTQKLPFKATTKCGFCSGAAVISNPAYRDEIIKNANRKVRGFDMEAYVLAIINYLYVNEVHTLVAKGIMDFGGRKNDSHKKAAKDNSATIAHQLIRFMVDNNKI